jgi:exportin-1
VIIPAHKESVKTFVVDLITKYTDSSVQDQSETKVILPKLNSILVEVIKKELNANWRSAIQDLCTSSYNNQEICENNMNILRMLSEDLFDFSKSEITSTKTKELKTNFAQDFTTIYQLCDYILKNHISTPGTVKISLVKSTLKTLLTFLSWMPLTYVFVSDLIEQILLVLVTDRKFTNLVLKCLSEIAGLEFQNLGNADDQRHIQMKMLSMISVFMQKIQEMVYVKIDMNMERKQKLVANNTNELAHFDNFCKDLANFFITFYRSNLNWLEDYATMSAINKNQEINIME